MASRPSPRARYIRSLSAATPPSGPGAGTIAAQLGTATTDLCYKGVPVQPNARPGHGLTRAVAMAAGATTTIRRSPIAPHALSLRPSRPSVVESWTVAGSALRGLLRYECGAVTLTVICIVPDHLLLDSRPIRVGHHPTQSVQAIEGEVHDLLC